MGDSRYVLAMNFQALFVRGGGESSPGFLVGLGMDWILPPPINSQMISMI